MITQFLDCSFNPSKNVTVLYSGQVKNEIHLRAIAKSTSPELLHLDTTFVLQQYYAG